jgi:type IX secretion system PorP/SprF family membrane protein
MTKIIQMKKILISLSLLTATFSYGQELYLPVATQYLADNPFVISPSYAGIGDNLRININGYKQWVGIQDAPSSQSLYADFRVMDRSGVGLNLYNDKNGYTLQTGGKITFAHHIILDYYSKQYLSFGISYILNTFRIDVAKLDPNDPDPAITNDRFTSNNNFEVGFLYRFKKYYLSFNATNILKKNTDYATTYEPNVLTNYQLYTGYVFSSPNNKRVELEPSIFYQLFQSDGRSSTDLNLKYRKFNKYEDYYYVGFSYRFLNDQIGKPLAVGPLVGFQKAYFTFGYAYQVTLNDLAGYNSGTHSLTIGFRFFQGVSNCPCTQRAVHD